MLINSVGEQEELACFKPGLKTEAYCSCAVNWRNQFHILGGLEEKRQISRLRGYKLERIGSLKFDHFYGGCSVMNNEHVFLCFNSGDPDDYRRCRRSTGPLETFSMVSSSKHNHHQTQISSSDSKPCCSITKSNFFQLFWLR